MKRKVYPNHRRFIQTNPNNIQNLKQRKTSRYKSKEEYFNVYEINAYGKFTVIVRSSFFRLHIRTTTTKNPCYRYDLSSICDSEDSLRSNWNSNHYLDRYRKRTKWKSLHGETKKSVETKESSTNIIYTSSIQNQNHYKEQSAAVIIQQGHSYYGFFAFLFAISVIIFGFILCHISMKSTQTPKSTIRPVSGDTDSDDSDDNNQNRIQKFDSYKVDVSSSQTNRTIDSLFDDDNDTNHLERKLSHNMTFSNIRNHHDEFCYEDIQMLIQKFQQSDLESINPSSIGQIISDLIHHAINIVNSNPNLPSSNDLLTFLTYTPQFLHILRTIIANKCSCQSVNPTNFLQCQYLIDILHSSEFILEYLHQHYPHDKLFLVQILTHLYQILSSMNNNSYRYQNICQSLSNILQELNNKQVSSLE